MTWTVEKQLKPAKDKQMKGPIEVLNDVHQAEKGNPDIYDAIQIKDGVFVEAILSLSNQLDHFKQSKQDKISPAQVQAMSNDLTRGALATKLSRVLANAGANGNEKEISLRIFQFLESL
jgi:hypothetical protein